MGGDRPARRSAGSRRRYGRGRRPRDAGHGRVARDRGPRRCGPCASPNPTADELRSRGPAHPCRRSGTTRRHRGARRTPIARRGTTRHPRHEVQPDRPGHGVRPGSRTTDRRRAALEPARRCHRRRGGRRSMRAPPGSNGTSIRSTEPPTSCTTCRVGARRWRSSTLTVRSPGRCTSRWPMNSSRRPEAAEPHSTACRSRVHRSPDCPRRSSGRGSATPPNVAPRRPGAWRACCPRYATSVASARPRSTSVSSPAGASTPISRSISTPGIWPPAC